MDPISTSLPLPVPAYQPAAGTLAQAAPRSISTQPASNAGNATTNIAPSAEQQRLAAVTQAALQLQTYPLGDQMLANIYKDTGGQFVATYINLRDNSVSHVPEQALLANSAAAQQPILNLEA